jgi:hypothetical protein
MMLKAVLSMYTFPSGVNLSCAKQYLYTIIFDVNKYGLILSTHINFWIWNFYKNIYILYLSYERCDIVNVWFWKWILRHIHHVFMMSNNVVTMLECYIE